VRRGYIRLWRKIFDTSFYSDPLTCRLAIHLMLCANHKEKKIVFNGEEMTVEKGQIIIGRNSLSEKTGIKPSSVRNKLLLLKKLGFLDIKSNNRFSVVSLLKYNDYQKEKVLRGQVVKQQLDNNLTSRGQPSDTNKNVKNEKNDNNSTTCMDKWNNCFPNNKIHSLTSTRKKHLAVRLQEKLFVDNFDLLLEKIARNDWLMGKTPSPKHPNFKATFDWIIKNDTYYVKILEGAYDQKPKTRAEMATRRSI